MSSRQLSPIPAGLFGVVLLVLAILPAFRGEAGDYLVDTWRFDDDLPRDGINSIAQGGDGYLWVSSRYGLGRFDGARFVNFNSKLGTQFVGHHYANLIPDRAGRVWIGTPGGGLAQWKDGRLLPCLRPGPSEIGPVFAGLTNAEGRDLAVTPGGRVLGWSNGVPELIASADRWGDVVPASLCQDQAGNIWFVTYQHKLVRCAGTNTQEMVYGAGAERRNWIALQAGAAGELWAGTQLGVGRWRGDQFEPIASPVETLLPVDDLIAIPQPEWGDGVGEFDRRGASSRRWVIADGRAWLMEGNRWITNVFFAANAGLYETSPRFADRQGNLWFTGTKAGLARAGADGSLILLTGETALPPGRVASSFEDQEGSVWVGIEHAGLVRLRERYFNLIGSREGLRAPSVWAVVEDPAGAIWLGTENNGLQRWQDGKLTQFDLGNNGLSASVYSLCVDRLGQLWAGTGDNRVFRFENGRFVLEWEDPGLGWNKRVYAIFQDRTGQMWFGTGMGLFRWRDGNVERISGKGFEVGVVRAIAEDATGRLWIGRSGGSELRLGWLEGDSLVPCGMEQGLKGYDVFGLHAGADGSMWIATVGDGLWRQRDGVFTRYGTEAGLPDGAIYSIAPDAAGNLWLTSPAGIIRVSAESVAGLASGRGTLDCLIYNRTDGLPTRECSGGAQPSVWRARGGRLLFAMTEGAVALSPERVRVNRLPPPVVIEEVRVDGKPRSSGERLRLEAGRRGVEFHYTATSLAAPSKVRFKYRLDGVDGAWREADASRSAVYSLTAPGDYQFHVIACNNDGVWNQTGATMALVVSPFFWQTWWFRVAAPLALFLTIGGTIRSVERRQVRRKLEQFEMQQRVEKERARIARDIHDELGASLTEIGLLSEFAQRDTAPAGQIKADIQKIASEARGCTRALDEIVWAVNPRNDTLDGFVTYACAYAEEHLRLAGIRCRLEAALPMPRRSLRADRRHHLFLAFKEALNNVVKHARATEVEIRLFAEGDRLNVLIRDNGCGFDPAVPSRGNGLANLKERLASAGGAFECESLPGCGTRLKLVISLE